MEHTKKSSRRLANKTPVEIQFIERLYQEWGRAIAVEDKSDNTATIDCKTPFTLGLLVGHVMNKWLKDGQGFDKMIIDTKACKATITVCKDARLNKLKVLWT